MEFGADRPIYQQLAQKLEDAILMGAFPEESQVPSTTEISATWRINPATALKGINQLVAEEVVYKKRGLGMFVRAGAKERIMEKRKKAFYDSYVAALLAEARRLGIGREELMAMIAREGDDE